MLNSVVTTLPHQVRHILAGDVALVRTWMHGDALCSETLAVYGELLPHPEYSRHGRYAAWRLLFMFTLSRVIVTF